MPHETDARRSAEADDLRLKAERIQLDEAEDSTDERLQRERRLEAGWRRRTIEATWRPRRRCA